MNSVAVEPLTIRQSHLRALEEQCPAMAYALAVEGREGPSGRGAGRGTVVHEVFSAYTEHLFAAGRQTDWEACERIAREVADRHPELLYAERQDVLAQAANIGRGFLFEPALYYGSEEAVTTDIRTPDGRHITLTGRLDLLEVCIDEGWARITDAKSNHVIPADGAVRDDFQLRTYAMLAFDSLPPAVSVIHGRLWLTRYNLLVPQKGEVAWTREDANEFKAYLAPKLQAFFDGELRSEFVPGTWCQYCPRRRPSDCTHWRLSGAAPTITNEEKARRVAARIVAEEQRLDALKASLKAWVASEGPVRIGSTTKAETFDNFVEMQTAYGAEAVLASLEEMASLVGPQPLNEILSVSKASKAFKALMRIPEFREAMEESATSKQVTRFKHKRVAEGVDDE
jgi:hypothetical protein